MSYLLSLGLGLLVGVAYALLGVRSPAPPIVALVGLLGMVAGEQGAIRAQHGLLFGHNCPCGPRLNSSECTERYRFARASLEGISVQLGTILLCANGLGSFSNQLSLSLTLGKRLACHVQVLAFRPKYPPFVSTADIAGVDSGAEAKNAAASGVDAVLDQRKRVFDDLVGMPRAGISNTKIFSATWEDLHGPIKESLPSYVRACDLIVSGGTSDDSSTSTLDDDVSRIALLESGRPVLFAGGQAAGNLFRRVLIAWNDGVPAARAVGYALPLIALADEVCLFVVESDPGRSTPVNQVLSYLRVHAPQTTVHAERSALHTIGHAILAQAESMQASLIVMGAYEHSRNRELLFGGTTRHVIQHARSPVFIST